MIYFTNPILEIRCIFGLHSMKKRQRTIFLLWLILLLWGTPRIAWSQTWGDVQFRNVNVSHGLPNNLSWRVLALDDRSLFVVCDYAFAVYDGAQFRSCPYDFRRRYRVDTYSNSASYVDRKRRVWIKNYVNLFLFDQSRGQFDYGIDSLFRAVGVKERVEDFFLDADQDAWLLTANGCLYLTDLEHQAHLAYRLTPEERKRGLHIVNVAQAGTECLWLDNEGTVRYYDKRRKRISRTEQRFGGHDPYLEYAWTTWGEHALLLGTPREQGGLWLYDSNTQQWRQVNAERHGYNRLLPMPNSGLVAVDAWGMMLFDSHLRLTHDLRTFHTEQGNYLNRDLLDATFDWQGGLWVSSYRYGLFYTHPRLPHLSTFPISAQSFDNVFMVADPRGAVYATQGDSIWRFEKGEKTCIYQSPHSAFSLLDTDAAHQRLFVRTSNRLLVFSPKGTEILTAADVEGLPTSPHVLAVLPDGQLFACMGRGTAGILDLDSHKFSSCPLPLAFRERYRDVRFVRYDEDGQRVVLGGKFGIFYYDLHTHRYAHFFPKGGDFGGHALCCNDYLRDSRGHQWFATNAGLFLLSKQQEHDAEQMTRLTATDGLLDNCVHAVVEDPQGDIWVMTSTGVTQVHLPDEATIHKSDLTFRRHLLGTLIGGGEFADRCLAFAQNKLWCGSTNGIVCMDIPEKVTRNDTLQVRLTERRQLNRNSLQLDFSACDYLHAGATTYRYWMDDEEEQARQVTASSLHLEYLQLESGTYHLHVQVQNADGRWSEPVEWTFRIQPPWWATWWAYLIYICACVCVFIAIRSIWRRWTWLHAQLKDRRNKMWVRATEVKPSEIEITSRDQQFLQKAVACVETHISDANYGVEELSADLALTRTALYRRLQHICGQSPADFLRTVRLRRAEQLLRESGLNIDEIAQQVGFNSARTFSTSFKQTYGTTPTAYRKDHS